MDFCRLVSAQDRLFGEAFAIYETSFPQHEQRRLDQQTALMSNPLYHFEVIAEDGLLAGFVLYWDGSGYTYVEHFAIRPSMRNKSMGAKSLNAFCRNHSLVILEIDPPVDRLSSRREGFYQRQGFQRNDGRHIHPAYQKQFSPHELVILSYPQRLTEEEGRIFRRELQEIFMKDVSPAEGV